MRVSLRACLQRGWVQPRWCNHLCRPLAWLYRVVGQIRHAAYRRGWLKTHALAIPVIVIGGLGVGGSGKTPLVIALAHWLRARGYRPGVITRGYRGQARRLPCPVTATTTAQEVGDEAQLIYEQAAVPVVVDTVRVRAGCYLLAHHACDIVLSDDGFQHLALQRTVDVVVVDGMLGLGNGWCLPAGPLREPPANLARADLVVINTVANQGDATAVHVHTYAGEVPCQTMTMVLTEAYHLFDDRVKTFADFVTDFGTDAVHAVAGLGHPDRFFTQLASHGLQLRRHAFPDHHAYCPADLDFGDTRAVLMTEKDAIKCRAFHSLAIAERLWVVRAHLEIAPDFYTQLNQLLRAAHSTP